MEDYTLKKLRENVYQFETFGRGCHLYLILGDRMNVLIDTGNYEKFNSFVYLVFSEIGIKFEEINIVINTHEHWDHLSGNHFFKCPVCAHSAAASKIELQDEYVIRAKECDFDVTDLKTDIWLEDGMIFDLGNEHLKIIHTPGHTSGCICIYDPYKYYMFGGDTVFANGYVSNIYESGSLADYINSLYKLKTLRIKTIYPGHGPLIDNPDEEIDASLLGAKLKLDEYIKHVQMKNPEGRPTPSVYERPDY
ncbi:MAG: MBL fold metallo-hydrolase [Candidatus Helarchaeota archaeon]